MHYHTQKTKNNFQCGLMKLSHTGEAIIHDLLFVYFIVLFAMLLYAIIQL